VAEIQDAYKLLSPVLGIGVASTLFALALLASGQNSTLTGTLAGQIVMEGFVQIRLRPWLRRLLTRSLAIIPAVCVILWKGEEAVDPLLVLSQVVLSLQLAFAVVPLIHFTSDRRKMGDFTSPKWARVLAWLAAAVIISLNLKLVFGIILDGFETHSVPIRFILTPIALMIVPLLVWIIIEPFWRVLRERRGVSVSTPTLPVAEITLSGQYRRVGLALEASPRDEEIITGILPLLHAAGCEVVLIHAVESATARFIGTMRLMADVRMRSGCLAIISEAGTIF
jgi:manganese transport protein